MRLILDASVIISVLVSDDKSYGRDILKLARDGKVEVTSTSEIFTELRNASKRESIKMLTKYKPAKFGAFIAWYQHNAKFVPIPPDAVASIKSRDIKDNKYLLLSEISRADYLITIDKDLLILKKIGRTKIITPEKFIKDNPKLSM